jgi:hypothetical protein
VTTEEIEVPPWIYEGATVMVRQSERTASGSPDISSAKVTGRLPRGAKVSIIIKPRRAVDEYVEWSTICEAPLFLGTRAEMLAELVHCERATCAEHDAEREKQRARLDRVDATGTSSHLGEGAYESTVIFEQRGTIKAELVGDLMRALDAGDKAAALALCEPFEDEGKVRDW